MNHTVRFYISLFALLCLANVAVADISYTNLDDSQASGGITESGKLTLENTADSTYSRAISTGTFEKTGSGKQILSGTLSIGGTAGTTSATISSGILELTGTSAPTIKSTGTVSVANGATLKFTDTVPHNSSNLAINLDFGGTLELYSSSVNLSSTGDPDANHSLTSNAYKNVTITGSGVIKKTGTGNYAMNYNNGGVPTISLDSTGKIWVAEGVLSAGGWSRLVATDNKGALQVDSGATFNLWDCNVSVGALLGDGKVTGTVSRTTNYTLSLGAGITDSASTSEFSGTIDFTTLSNYTIAKTGAGTQIINGTYTNKGTTTVSAGALTLAGTSTLGTLNNSAMLNVSSATTVSGTFNNSGTLNIESTGRVNINAANTIGGTLTGSGKLAINNGESTFTANASAFSGTLEISNKNTRFDSRANLGSAKILLSGGTFMNYGINGSSPTLPVANDIELAPDTASSIRSGWTDHITISGNITGSGELQIANDSGEVTLSGANTYSGGTKIGGGINGYTGQGKLNLGANNALGTGPVTFGSNNSTLNMGSFTQTFGGLGNQNGTGYFTGNSISTASSAIDLNFDVAAGGDYKYNGALPTVNNITKSGAGMQAIYGNHTLTNLTVNGGGMIFGGTLSATNITLGENATLGFIGSAASFDLGGAYTVKSGNTLLYSDAAPKQATDTTITLESNGTLELYSSVSTTGDPDDNHSLTSSASKNVTITGSGIIKKTGTGNYAMHNSTSSSVPTINLDSTGKIWVAEGVLSAGGWSKLVATDNKGALQVDSGATFNLWDCNVSVGALLGAGKVLGTHDKKSTNYTLSLGAGITDSNSTSEFSGTILFTSASNCIVKTGAGTQIINGAYTNESTTTVSEGTLTLAGTSTLGTATVTAGALTLAGTSTLGTLNNSAMLNVSSGTTVSGTFNNSGTLNIEFTGTVNINAANTIGGTLTGSGRLAINNGESTFTANASAFSGTLEISNKNTRFDSHADLGSAKILLSGGTFMNYGDNGSSPILPVANDIELAADTASSIRSGWTGHITISGNITGSGELQIANDSGQVTLSGANTYSGGTKIGGGINGFSSGQGKLNLGANNALGTGPVTFGSNNSTLNMDSFTQTFGGLGNQNGTGYFTGNSISADSAIDLNFDVAAGGDYKYNGALPTVNNITKSGAGMQTLTQNFTLENLTLNGGTLVLTGDSTVNNSPTFNGGTLAIAGTLTHSAPLVITKGTLEALSNSNPGVVTVSQDGVIKTLSSNSNYTTSLGSPTFTDNGVLEIELAADGTFSKFSMATNPVFNSSFGFIDLLDEEITLQPGLSYTLADTIGTMSASENLESWLTASDRHYWNLNWVNGTGLVLSIDANAVPEPSAWLLMVLSVCGLFYFRGVRSRRQK